jgi:hypothetical protein
MTTIRQVIANAIFGREVILTKPPEVLQSKRTFRLANHAYSVSGSWFDEETSPLYPAQ